ncbi:hypothetical protein MKW94_024462 [Papaver nudicaule]|uniref:DUF3444 domain-containing protein n=1 Tax=Papaver nudicaule TaxID=74823 RepID=A0AA41SC40_PAPNU|nr:hypothetical protein [Papaver nudicaule]
MNVTQIKKEEDLDMQSPPGFARKASNGQGTGTGANDHGNKGNKEADIIRKGDEQAGRSNRITEEVAEDDDDHCEQEVVDPDFYGFNKSEDCIAVGQIWAIISDFDGNPRFYAKIKKVYSPFKVDVTWLVFVAGDLDEVAWKRSGVPVACGKFKHGLTVTIENMRSFSHMMLKEKGSENSYIIYPRKGETWALRKNWNITWSSDPDNHNREYEYEFVVVLSAYTKKAGILVANLVKLEGKR